jgi:ribosomal protein L29
MATVKQKDQLKELRGLSIDKLSGKIAESQKDLVLKQQDKLLGKIKNIKELSILRKSVARMKTVLDEKLAEQVKDK